MVVDIQGEGQQNGIFVNKDVDDFSNVDLLYVLAKEDVNGLLRRGEFILEDKGFRY